MGALGGERAAWEVRGQQVDRRRETIGGEEKARAVNRGLIQMYGKAKTGDCMRFQVNREAQRWGELRAYWNGAVRAQGHNTRAQAGCWIRTQDSRGWKVLEEGIRIASLNIRPGRAGGLEAALRALQQRNVDVGVLQETKIPKGIHMRYGSGYTVCATQSEIRHQGGVAVAWREKAGWQVEGIANYGPNVVSFLLMTGRCRWYVFGVYVPPNNAPNVDHVEQALW